MWAKKPEYAIQIGEMTMKMTKGRKNAVVAGLVLFLGIAVFANWYYTGPKSAEEAGNASGVDTSNVNSQNLGDAVYVGASGVSDEYFAGAKLSRDESYDEAVATLKEIVDSSDADEQSVQTAAASISAMSERKIAQVNIENLVKAKTGSECIAVLSEDSAEIIVKKDAINEESALQIKEIVMANADISPEKITIIGAK